MNHLHVIFSNRIEKLMERFSATISEPLNTQFNTDFNTADFLAGETVLIDNRMMGEWLNLQLAQQQGIAANIDYIQPSGLFWRLAKSLCANVPQEAPLQKEEMKWRLANILKDESLLAKPVMLPVKNYLADDDCKELKRYQLASSIADLFDQYLVFRPHWLLHWQNSHPPLFSGDSNEAWQRELWLQFFANPADKSVTRHRAAIEQELLTLLQTTDSTSIQQKIPYKRLFVFGITSMPPAFLNVLAHLGRHIPVTLFVLNPCQEYWELIRSKKALARQSNATKSNSTKSNAAEDDYYEIGNPLLASQGVQVKEFIDQLLEIADADYLVDGNATSASLLQSIQHEILELRYQGHDASGGYISNGNTQSFSDLNDAAANSIPSIHIHQCHSAHREVEVLHDQLRDMLHKMPQLNTRDIVVMMPTVASYVPYINAVFNGVEESRRLPFHILDRSAAEESPLLNSFALLLQFPASRVTLSDVLAILEVPAVQKRFSLDQDAFEHIRQWLIDAGVRWGIDASERMKTGSPAFHEYSFEFALNRLISGYAMTVEDTLAVDNLLPLSECGYEVMPLDVIEGSYANTFNQFLLFWQTLLNFRESCKRPRQAGEWYNDLLQLIDAMYEEETEDDGRALASLRTSIYELRKVELQQWYNGDIALTVIVNLLKPALQQAATGRHHWQEGIKFCSLLPMRAVPFRVVYIMGMNLEDYPRRIDKTSFDLMRNRHQAGDRASRIDDRWLFLEALLSARDVFHISYIARDMHRNEKREPSVVLSELMDYIRYGYFDDSDAGNKAFKQSLFTQHPLQPFSADYFLQNKQALSPRLFSFNRQAFDIANAKYHEMHLPQQNQQRDGSRWLTTEKAANATSDSNTIIELTLSEFVRFFTKPYDWFFTNKYRLDLSIENDGVNDEEDYEQGNGLVQWQVRDELIHAINNECKKTSPQNFPDILDNYIAVRKAKAAWPVGSKSETIRQEYLDERDFLYSSSEKIMEKCGIEYSVNIKGVTVIIKGEISLTDDNNGEKTVLFEHSPSKSGDDKELAWIIKTALSKEALPALAYAECIYRDKTHSISSGLCEQLVETGLIKQLVELYLQYNGTGLPFSAALYKKIAELEMRKESGNEQFKEQLNEQFNELVDTAWYGDYNSAGIAGDLKQRTYFGSPDALYDSAFTATCCKMQQLFAAYIDVKKSRKDK